MSLKQYSYIGVGKMSLRLFGSNDPFIFIGNAPDLGIKIKDKEIKQGDFTAVGGGTLDTVSRIDSVSLEMTLSNISASNVAIAVMGVIKAQETTSAITDESLIIGNVEVGGIYPLLRLPDPAKALTVENKAGDKTYAEGADYVRSVSGIELLAGTTIAAGELLVSYAPLAEDAVEALVGAQKEYELLFEGMNEARDGLPRVVNAWRWKPSPSDCDYIGDKFGLLKLAGELLKDDSKTGVGASKYFRDRIARIPG